MEKPIRLFKIIFAMPKLILWGDQINLLSHSIVDGALFFMLRYEC